MSAGRGVRPARFAGSWYPGRPDDLAAAVDDALARAPTSGATGAWPAPPPGAPVAAGGRVLGVVAPHAGYRYALDVAAAAYARVDVPARVVVLCPNHTVPPPVISVWARGAWETPLGPVPVDEPLADALLEACAGACPEARADEGAHLREHAVELHLPLLQRRRAGRPLAVVPVVVAPSGWAGLEAFGRALAQALAGAGAGGREVLVVASTDMNHHEDRGATARKDARALEALLAADPRELVLRCERERISMCGVRPTAAALVAARALGAVAVEPCAHADSGDAAGGRSPGGAGEADPAARVVGYASALLRVRDASPGPPS